MNAENSTSQSSYCHGAVPDRWLTVPNALCVVRLIGSLALFPIAMHEKPSSFLLTYLALAATDWVDGRIARSLNQRSRIGAKLDSLSDAAMFAALLFGVFWLFGNTLSGDYPLILAAVGSYMVSCLLTLVKFGRLPSYHTRAAKVSWFLTSVAVVALFLQWSLWPLRVAALLVTLANCEAILITAVMTEIQDDVPTLWHAVRQRHTTAG